MGAGEACAISIHRRGSAPRRGESVAVTIWGPEDRRDRRGTGLSRAQRGVLRLRVRQVAVFDRPVT
jgi:hypothetical protein